MAAPQFVPLSPVDPVRSYTSPDHVPDRWVADRPGEVAGRQPAGARLGNQGPDQGYALVLAKRFADRLVLADGEQSSDATSGCLTIALRRASMFGRAPVVHDLTIAFTIWGYLATDAPADLVALRRKAFEGVGNSVHHYSEGRDIADAIPAATLRMNPEQVRDAFPGRWRELIGV